MLYHLLYPLHESYSFFNVFKYITFRTFCAGLTALFLSFLLGPFFIRVLKLRQLGQVIRTDGPSSHAVKQGTPTMGGILILCCMVLATLLWIDLRNPYMGPLLFVIVGFGLIGFADDYRKIVLKNSKGLSAKTKFLLQILFATAVALWLYLTHPVDTTLTFPFFKNLKIPLDWLYVPFMVFVVVGTSNAVNLTDGLDGLAIGPVIIASGTFAILAYVAGHAKIAQYL
ncbi:MAG: phospho-N-acetylmuramoyl-pentapeptide-transferase, partial [Deltaproteobacteria bacterium]